jgi:hypothetical protein
VEEVIAGLRFLGAHQRSAVKRQAVEDLQRYLSTNRARMRYRTFRDAGFQIGSGTAESAIGHVVQHRMKRAGMRRGAPGADAMLALRSVYRSTAAWDTFWRARALCWQEVPESKALIEGMAAAGPLPVVIGPAGLRHLDLLGGELARCSGAGIRVIVISLPQNAAVRHDCTAADRLLAGWAARHHLELDRYWNSGLVPTTHFVDTDHFDGDGADIVAAVLAGRILGGPQP